MSASCAAQTSRTHPRSQRCAGSASSRGCQSNETVISGMATGSGKLCIPARRFPVCRSGTLAIRSEARASASAVEKPPTIVTISPFQPERLQGFIDRSLVEAPPRDADVPAGRIAGGRDLALAQRVPRSHDADEAVPEQGLRAHLRTGRLPHDAGFQIDGPVAKRRAVLVRLLHEAQPHAGRFLADASDEVRPEVLDEAFAGPQRERSDELLRGRASRPGAAPLRASCTS